MFIALNFMNRIHILYSRLVICIAIITHLIYIPFRIRITIKGITIHLIIIVILTHG